MLGRRERQGYEHLRAGCALSLSFSLIAMVAGAAGVPARKHEGVGDHDYDASLADRRCQVIVMLRGRRGGTRLVGRARRVQSWRFGAGHEHLGLILAAICLIVNFVWTLFWASFFINYFGLLGRASVPASSSSASFINHRVLAGCAIGWAGTARLLLGCPSSTSWRSCA